MSAFSGWPKDTSPNAIARANQTALMSKAEAINDLRSAQLELNERLWRHRFASLNTRIAIDPAGTEMQTLGTALRKADVLVILNLFVFLYYEAPDMERMLNTLTDERKGLVMKQFEFIVSGLFGGRQIVDEGLFLYYSKNPAELRTYLELGLASSRVMWGTLQNAAEKNKFLSDAFDSPKGYPKTARSIADWTPPRLINLTTTLTHWLDSFNNTSVFSGMSVTTTVTNREQIISGYLTATATQRDYLWFLIFFQAGSALGEDTAVGVSAAMLQRRPQLTAALHGTPAAADVNAQVARCNAIWTSIMG